VICQPVSLDRYGRTVASCAADGTDVAEWLVRQELALDRPRCSQERFVKAQDEAHRNERGMWAGSYVEPWRFRECVKHGGRPASCSDEAR
jgi:endonuclease YncB( thermonuclease family)